MSAIKPMANQRVNMFDLNFENDDNFDESSAVKIFSAIPRATLNSTISKFPEVASESEEEVVTGKFSDQLLA